MGVKATDFGSILIEQRVGFRGDKKFPEMFLPTKQVGAGTFGRNVNDKFGYSVAIDGELAAVGVPSQDYDENGQNAEPEAGAVFVYRRTRNSWEFAYRIAAPEIARDAGDNFGYSVSLKGNTLVVGSPMHATDAAQSNPKVGAGAAFAYHVTADSAELEGSFYPAVRDAGDNFGINVHAQEDAVFVSSYLHSRNEKEIIDAVEAGAVWAYARDKVSKTWSLTKKITAGGNERNAGDNFGKSVSAHKNIMAVGVPNYDYVGKGEDYRDGAGAVYVFEWQTDHWRYKSVLLAPDRLEDDNFGAAVGVYDKRIVVGAPGKNGNKGKVYLYAQNALGKYVVADQMEPSAVELPADFVPSTSTTLLNNARFGAAVSMNADTIAVGAPGQHSLLIQSVDSSVTPKTWTASEQLNTGFAYVYSVDAANTVTRINKITSSDRFNDVLAQKENGEFGFSLSLGTNILIIGEPKANLGAYGTDFRAAAGIAHIYVKNGSSYEWSKTIEGFGMDRNAQDAFATAFDQNERFMVFTAPGQDYDANSDHFASAAGAAYVWEKVANSWVFRQKLVASDRAVNEVFGSNVIVNGDRIFVQAKTADSTGAVYVFRFENGAFVEKQKLSHVDLKTGDLFGSVMAAKDNRFYASSTTHKVGTVSHGAVFAYALDGATDTFVFEAKIVPTTSIRLGSLFGTSLAVNDNILVVGASGHDLDSDDALEMANSGAAFVFARTNTTWTQINKLTGPGDERLANSLMGYSVSSYGNMLAVGIPKSDYDAALLKYRTDAGKVLLYTRSGSSWTLSATISSPNRQANGLFGTSLAMGNNRLVVGAPGEFVSGQANGWGDGKAYVFEKVYGDWIVTGTLENLEVAPGGEKRRFGWSVALDGDRVVVGEPQAVTDASGNTPITGAGAAWVFEKENSAWVFKSKLTAETLGGRQSNSNFGHSVDIHGDIIIVGSPFDATNSAGASSLTAAGSAYLFRRAVSSTGTVSWNPEKKLAGWAQDRNVDDLFGSNIAAFGNYVAIGATGQDYDDNLDNFVNNAGAVFVYEWVNNVLVYRQKLVAHSQADRISNIGFGGTVAINSTHIVVSAPRYGIASGRALGKVWSYKLENGFWVKERTFVQANTNEINANSSAVQPQFGTSLALGHLVLAIGAPASFYGDANVSVDNSGAVDIYRYNVDLWEFEKTIVPSNRESGDYFGETIVLRDNLVIVGGRAAQSSSTAMNDDGQAMVGGAAWVFSYNIPNWTYTHKIARGGAELIGLDSFGTSVSVSGTTMVVGAPTQSLGNSGKNAVIGAGAAYVFSLINGAWQFEKRLVASDRQANAKFGTDVVVKNDLIWVGAPGADTGFGAVYGYRKNINKTNTRRIRRTANFAATGASQSFTVPANVEEVTFYMWGAAGGVSATGADGGNGGFVRVNVQTTPGEILTLNVGTKPAAGGGGGRTELLRGSSTLAVAAGGGGAIANVADFVGIAGSAGGFQGEDGFSGSERALAGLGGSQTAGGAARTASGYVSGLAGGFKQGGNAPVDAIATVIAGGWPNGGSGIFRGTDYAIAGGGDGWYGGSAGAIVDSKSNASAPGGAGSCYIAPGIEGFSQTVKTEFDDVFVNFADSTRPGLDASGMIIVEYFETYVSDEWDFETKLQPTAPRNAASGFGGTVEFDGATLIVGLPTHTLTSIGINANNPLGRVDVFEFNGFEWEETAKLYPFGDNGSVVLQGFAETLSVSGDYIVVGAYNAQYDEAGENPLAQAGIAFAYRKNAGVWGEMQRIAPPGNTRNNGDLIGSQLVQYGDWIFVGAPEHDFDANGSGKLLNAGAVMVWKWVDGVLTYQHKIIAPDEVRTPHARFGFAMEMAGDQLLVGAPTRTDIANFTPNSGHVIVVELTEDNVWEGTQILTSPAGSNLTYQLGYALAVSGDTLAAGSPAGKYPTDATVTKNGAVQMFVRDADGIWNYSKTVLPTIDAGLTGDTFGLTVTLNDDFLIVGTPKHGLDQSGANLQSNAGAARFFQNESGTWVERQKIVAWGHDLVTGENTGATISAADTIVAVGSPKHPYDSKGNNYLVNAGAVYVWRYESNTWVLEQKLTAPNRTANANFGSSIALSESRIAVGAPSLDDNTKSGAAFVFEKTAGDSSLYAWNAGSQLAPTGTNATLAGDQFGFSVALNGDSEVIVGAPLHDYDVSGANKLDNAGAVYVFKKTSLWSMVQKLVSTAKHLGVDGINGRNSNDKFGTAVAASGNSIIVGAPNRFYDSRGQLALSGAGSAIAFSRPSETDLYTQTQFLTSRMNTPAAGDRVGAAVSGYGDYFVVGAPSNSYDALEDNYVLSAGSAYVWHWNGASWDYIQKLSATPGSNYGRNLNAAYGSTLKLNGTTLVVGAPQTTVGGVVNQGVVFVYELVDGLFEQVQVLKEIYDTTNDARFGSAVDFDGTTLVVGAPDSGTGRVSFYERTDGQFGLINSVVQPGSALARFGLSVSVEGPIAVAGAPDADYAGTTAGAAIVMRKQDGIWLYEQTIYNQRPVAESTMGFGASIAYEGDDLFVGAPIHDYDRLNVLKVDAGAVFYFTKVDGKWTFKQKITPVGTAYHNSNDKFGFSVSVSNGRLAVGAPNHKYNSQGTFVNSNHGAVYVFEKGDDNFYYTRARISPDGYGSSGVNEFGYSTIIEEDLIVVGAPANEFGASVADPELINAGAVMIYKFVDEEWFFVGKGLPFGKNGRQVNLRFGAKLTLGDGYLAVSCPSYAYDENGESSGNAGGVWVFKVESLDKISVNLIGGNALIPATTTSVYSADGFFESVKVISGGTGYKSVPQVVFSSDNFAGYAEMVPVGIGEAKLISFNPSANSPTVSVVNDPSDTTGSGAVVEVVRALGSANSIVVTDPGAGYTDVPVAYATPAQDLVLKALLQSTSLQSLTLNNTGSGFTSIPTVSIAAPESGTTALAHAELTIDNLVINATDKSYVGEKFAIVLGAINAQLTTTTVDGNRNITAVSLDNPGQFANLTSFNSIPTTRIVDTQSFGKITDAVASSITIDYGDLSTATSSDDYGLATDPATTYDDFMFDAGFISYGSITTPVVDNYSYGPIHESTLTVNATARVKTLTLDNPGAGYRSIPVVTISGPSVVSATATANIVPTGVESIEIVSGGSSIVDTTTISIVGANTSPAHAVLGISQGPITGLNIVSPGTNYSRTPSLVFSDSTFIGSVSLAPTSVKSIVVTQADYTLTNRGKLLEIKRIGEPESRRKGDAQFGASVVGSGNTLAIGSPTAAITTDANTTKIGSGSIMVYDVEAVSDKNSKIAVNGWLNATSAISGVTDKFSVSMWIRNTQKQKALNQGTLLAILNTDSRANFFTPVVTTDSGTFTVPNNVSQINLSAWGAGNSSTSVLARNGGYVYALLNVTPGDVFDYTVGNGVSAGYTVIKKNGTTVATVGSGFNFNNIPIPTLGSYGEPSLGGTTLPRNITSSNVNQTTSPITLSKYAHITSMKDTYGNQLIVGDHTGGMYSPVDAVSVQTDGTGRMIKADKGWAMSYNGAFYEAVVGVKHTKTAWSSDRGYIRYSDTFTNTTNVKKTMQFSVVLFGDGSNVRAITPVFNTAQYGTGAIGYAYRDNDPSYALYLAMLLHDKDPSSEKVPAVTGTPSYTVVLEPGQTKTYLQFLTFATVVDGANRDPYTSAIEVLDKSTNAKMLEGLSAETIATIVNWKVSTPDNQYTTTADNVFTTRIDGGGNSNFAAKYYNGTSGKASVSGTANPGQIAIYPIPTDNANKHTLTVSNQGKVTVNGNTGPVVAGYVGEIEDEWNNVTYVYDNGLAKVYFNGSLVGAAAIDGDLASGNILSLGAKFGEEETTSASQEGYIGYMADIAVWNTALTDTQVQDIQATDPSSVATSNLKAHWAKN